MWLPAEIMAAITKRRRIQQKIWWRSDSLVHNAFMLWKLIFWTPYGPRCENSVATDGVTETHRYHTWEALFFAIEDAILHPKFYFPLRVHIPMLQTSAGQRMFASPYLFAITFDASGSATGTPPSATVTRGTGASDYVGIAQYLPFGPGRSVSASTWAGAAMTLAMDSTTNTLDGAASHTYIYFIAAPASGAQTVTATLVLSYGLQAFTFSGVDQTNPLDPDFGGSGIKFKDAQSSINNGAELTVTGTSHIDSSLGIGMAEFTGGSITAGTNSTQLLAVQFFSYVETTATSPAGNMSMAVSNNSGSAENIYFGFVAMQPVAGAAGAERDGRALTLLGVG